LSFDERDLDRLVGGHDPLRIRVRKSAIGSVMLMRPYQLDLVMPGM
jgi:hypothetical protein